MIKVNMSQEFRLKKYRWDKKLFNWKNKNESLISLSLSNRNIRNKKNDIAFPLLPSWLTTAIPKIKIICFPQLIPEKKQPPWSVL